MSQLNSQFQQKKDVAIYLAMLILFVLFTLCLPNISFAIGFSGKTLSNTACTGNGQSFGPFDYWTVKHAAKSSRLAVEARLWEVDKIHYGKGKQIMESSQLTPVTYRQIWHEFDYTLRAFPNHTQALFAMIKLELERRRVQKLTASRIPLEMTPPECYLIRASEFRPKQVDIHLLYGYYLYKVGREDQAIAQYKLAVKLDPNNPEAHYNLGLLYVDKKQFKNAVHHARLAYKLGYQLPGLQMKLKNNGYSITDSKSTDGNKH
jgi:tetratricopeptide (TPR) repeat protein